MLDVAWSELAVIAVVALVVINPDDLPKLLRTAKGWIRQFQEFKQEIGAVANNIIHEAEITEAKEALKQEAAAINSRIRQIVDLEGNVRDAYDVSDILPGSNQREQPGEKQPPP